MNGNNMRRTQPSEKELVTYNEVRHHLFLDNISRKTRHWPLLSREECKAQWRNVHKYSGKQYFVNIPCCMPIRNHIIPSANTDDWNVSEKIAIETLDNTFGLLTHLLCKFSGKIVAAGGSVARSIWLNYVHCDCDLFFIGSEFQETLFEALQFIRERMFSYYGKVLVDKYKDKYEFPPIPGIHIVRNNYTVSVHLYVKSGDEHNPYIVRDEKYQFILRAYPTIGHVLGGFDIQAAAVCYDGKRITGTRFGVWSCFNRIIIADTTRRSTSYEYRLRKYSSYCWILLPGIDMDAINRDVEQEKNIIQQNAEEEIGQYITELAKRDIIVEKGSRTTLYMNTKKPQKQIEKELMDIAAQNGYKITKLEMQVARVDSNTRVQIYKDIAQIAKKYHMNSKRMHVYHHEPREKDVPHPYLKLKLINQQNISSKYPLKIEGSGGSVSDYFGDEQSINDSANAFWLINQIERVYISRELTPESDILNLLTDMNLEESLPRYIQSVETVYDGIIANLRAGTTVYKRKLNSMYEFRDEILNLIKCADQLASITAAHVDDKYAYAPIYEEVTKRIEEIKIIMIARLISNAELVSARMKTINWITENPGRQWTSSINPIFANPRDWYGQYYLPMVIGNREMEFTLRLMWRYRKPFNMLPRVIFNMILLRVLIADSEENLVGKRIKTTIDRSKYHQPPATKKSIAIRHFL